MMAWHRGSSERSTLFLRVFFQIEQLRRLPVIVDVFPVFAPDHTLKSAFGRPELVSTVFGKGDVLPKLWR